MKIKDIMTSGVAAVAPEATVEQAAHLMRDAGVGFLPVAANGMVLGVLTDRDIVVRAAARGLDLRAAKVVDVLTPGAVHCGLDEEAGVAAALMAENHVRRVVVVNADETLAGVLSASDIASRAPVEETEYSSLRGAGASETGETPSGRMRSLVRRELSAVEVYKLAIAKVGGQSAGDELWRIEREHEQAVDLLLAGIRRRGETPPLGSGLRGAWSKAREGAAMMLGRRAAVKALKSGEERGLHEYEDALKDEALDAEAKELIRARLLPQTRAHLPALERIMTAVV